MAFETSVPFILQSEGFYCNWKNDRGGETWRGIARNKWPTWEGWQYIDEAKSVMNPYMTRVSWNNFSKYVMDNYPGLEDYVGAFYRQNFWDSMQCDQFHEAIGHLLFDFSVNSGNSRAVKHLQKSLVTNGIPVTVDGAMGPGTIGAAQQGDPGAICQSMMEDRVAFYQVLSQQPGQAENLAGWLARVQADSDFIQQFFA